MYFFYTSAPYRIRILDMELMTWCVTFKFCFCFIQISFRTFVQLLLELQACTKLIKNTSRWHKHLILFIEWTADMLMKSLGPVDPIPSCTDSSQDLDSGKRNKPKIVLRLLPLAATGTRIMAIILNYVCRSWPFRQMSQFFLVPPSSCKVWSASYCLLRGKLSSDVVEASKRRFQIHRDSFL